MTRFSLGLNQVVRIPDSWTIFLYGGWLYRKNKKGIWVLTPRRSKVQVPSKANSFRTPHAS